MTTSSPLMFASLSNANFLMSSQSRLQRLLIVGLRLLTMLS